MINFFLNFNIVIEGKNLIDLNGDGSSNPYILINCGNKSKRTKVIRNTLNPKWRVGSQSEKFKLYVSILKIRHIFVFF